MDYNNLQAYYQPKCYYQSSCRFRNTSNQYCYNQYYDYSHSSTRYPINVHYYSCNFQTLPSTGTYSSGSVTGTTPTLTPTTLHNLEQTFLDFQNNPATSSASSGHSNATQGRESGFVPPIVHAYNTTTTPVMVQVKSEVDENSLGSEQDLSLSMADNNSWVNNEDSNSSNFNVPNIDPNTYLVANSRRPTGPRKLKKEELVSLVCIGQAILYYSDSLGVLKSNRMFSERRLFGPD